jgi:lauroyl/myristoyl acyltransferase
MSARFYRTTTAISRRTGSWFFRVSAWFVAAGFFFLFPNRVATSVRFYRALYPEKSLAYALRCAWRQYHNFTAVFLDRHRLEAGERIEYTSRGWEHLETALAEGNGAILLMSHLGNWEMAAHLLKRRGPEIPLMLYMGTRRREQIETMQKQSLARRGIRVAAADPDAGSPLDIIEGLSFLRSGGIVSMTGDVIRPRDRRTVPVEFLGHEARVSEIPHTLALASGAPILVLFAFRTGDARYVFSLTEPRHVRARNRADRHAAARRSARAYANLLERTLREHPLEWYHFRPFLGNRLPPSGAFGENPTDSNDL